ncbi:hypothetical protein [Porcincola intestinalis]|uniref:hypothetical protein n=1 Tax=Porcincola intestinalis TaxID=2606632 RepID=UPI002A919BEE|nr:hypothetical protein [Porcincola intestinalis]MDY5579339.1 hypothetical protein [Porcincola intestinalis]
MQYQIEDILEADFGCEEREEGAPLLCCLVLSADGKRIYRNIPDELARKYALTKGIVLTEEELRGLETGIVLEIDHSAQGSR